MSTEITSTEPSTEPNEPIEPSTNPEPTATEPTAAEPTARLDLQFVPDDMREDFDASVNELTGVMTPIRGISEALMASLVTGAPDALQIQGTAGVAYVQVRHVVTPIVLAEGSQHVLAPMLAAITSQLRAHVRETELATHTGVSPDTSRGLSYDVYVPDGAGLEPPEGFEVLPIRVWRRNVC